MADGEILERIDAHMARGNEHMARGNELMAELKEEVARSSQLHWDTRQFMRDIIRRNEIVMRDLTAEMREGFAGNRQVLTDLHEESVAQRQAIISLIDELREHGLGGRG